MMVRSAIQAVFITRDPVLKIDLDSEPAVSEQLQRAIDSCVPDIGIFHPHKPMEIIGAEVLAGFKENLDDQISPGTLLQALLAKVTAQNPFSDLKQILGSCGFVINAF
jgi:hypothetical protein